MIKYLNNKNNYDFIHKFQWIKSKNKPKLKKLIIDTNNNNVIKKPSLIYPTYYSLLLLFNQRPLIKRTKKSINNFNIKPNMNLGIFLCINKNSYFLTDLFYYINSSLNKSNKSIQYIKNYYNIQLNYGIKNVNNINNILNLNIGGANLTFLFKSPVKYVPFFYLK